MPVSDEIADRYAQIAARLAALIRDEDPVEVDRWFDNALAYVALLSGRDEPDIRDAKIVALCAAAAMRVDVPFTELTAWAWAPVKQRRLALIEAVALDPERVRLARELAATGLSVRQIALKLRTGHRTVLGWLDLPDSAVEDVGPFNPLAVEQAVDGLDVKLSQAEKREAVRRLTERGLSTTEVAKWLRTSTRAVQRHKAELRKAEGKAA